MKDVQDWYVAQVNRAVGRDDESAVVELTEQFAEESARWRRRGTLKRLHVRQAPSPPRPAA